MEIIKVQDSSYHKYIVDSQVRMALETEGYDLNRESVSSGVIAVINDPLKGNYFVAVIDSCPVACLLTVPEWSDWRNKTVLWIHSVFVSEKYRKQGIYRKMYAYLKQIVKESNEYAGLRLYVDKRNTSAIEVYHKLGMESQHYALCEWLKN